MSYLDRVVNFIQREKGAHSDLADHYEEFGTLFHKRCVGSGDGRPRVEEAGPEAARVTASPRARRLWHQLSEAVVDFVEDEANSRARNFVEVRTTTDPARGRCRRP